MVLNQSTIKSVVDGCKTACSVPFLTQVICRVLKFQISSIIVVFYLKNFNFSSLKN